MFPFLIFLLLVYLNLFISLNQASVLECIFLISDLAGERRFALIVAKRLESLGALTHGDRCASESHDFSQFNIDNKYGHSALEATLKAATGHG